MTGPGEPRFDDDEVQRVFELASRQGDPASPGGPRAGGLTLDELRAIGREVGLPEDAVSRAAALVKSGGSVAPRRHVAGIPIGVGRTAPLPGGLSDRAWELLVVDLREIFNARGRTESQGGLKQWTNGNLQILLEPTDGGHQLRMRTTNASYRARLTAGATVGLLGVFLAFAEGLAASGNLSGEILMVLVGVALVASAVFQAPGWADTREQQFARVAARAAELAEGERPE